MNRTPRPQSLGHGVHSLPAPLPFERPRWVNCYAIESEGGLTLIDCGCDWEPGRAALDRGLADLGLAEAPVHTLVVTHLHPDHVGMAPRLVRAWGCRFVMHRRAAGLVGRYNDTAGFLAHTREMAGRHGAPDQAAAALAPEGPRPAYMPPLDPPDVVVEDGDTLDLGGGRRLEVLHTPGHDPSHICLLDSATGAVFSGDHVLPRISPVIMHDPDFEDVLGDYLRSLRRLVALPIGLTYPAHGTIIERGADRARQILLHHHRRLHEMGERVAASPTTGWRLMGDIFRPNLSPTDQRLALLETLSHLEHLELAGPITSEERDGVVWYRRAARNSRFGP